MPSAVTRPNILWISLEDSSPRLGCYGDSVARTPHIDSVAAGGIRFTNAFSTAPVCAPSRCAVITGVYAADIGAQHQRVSHFDPEVPGFPSPYTCVPPTHIKAFSEQLRSEGYFCTNNGKCDYQFSLKGNEGPFSAWDLCGQPKDLEAVHWRRRTSVDQPFFAVFNLHDTHESGMWEREGEQLVTDPAAVTVPPWLPDTLEVRKTIARQYDNLARNDEIAGQLLRQLDEDGLTDSTIVMIWSDHGEGLPRSKRFLYDSGIHVPLIARWPGVLAKGFVEEHLVSLVDLAPTVLTLCGLEVPQHFQGVPFAGPKQKMREYVFATRDRLDADRGRMRAVRDRRFKYIRNLHPDRPSLHRAVYAERHDAWKALRRGWLEGTLDSVQEAIFQAPRAAEELYDIENDPQELQNLAADPELMEDLTRLRAALDAWMRDCDRCGDVAEDVLARTFWPDGKMPRTADPCGFISSVDFPSLRPLRDGEEVIGPAALTLTCGTPGSSIGVADSDSSVFRPYNGQIRLPVGTTMLRAKAVRYGCEPSGEVTLRITIKGGA